MTEDAPSKGYTLTSLEDRGIISIELNEGDVSYGYKDTHHVAFVLDDVRALTAANNEWFRVWVGSNTPITIRHTSKAGSDNNLDLYNELRDLWQKHSNDN